MGTGRDMLRTALLALCFGAGAIGSWSFFEKRGSYDNVVGLMERKRVNAVKAGRPVGFYDDMLKAQKDMGVDYSTAIYAGATCLAAGLGRGFVRRRE
jgi:hypothetical protein